MSKDSVAQKKVKSFFVFFLFLLIETCHSNTHTQTYIELLRRMNTIETTKKELINMILISNNVQILSLIYVVRCCKAFASRLANSSCVISCCLLSSAIC